MKTLDMTYEQMLAVAKPILFSTPMVQAILDGRKTMTRRVIKPQPVLENGLWMLGGAGWTDNIKTFHPVPCHSLYNRMPYKPGDVLYVRETWMPETEQDIPTGGYIYAAGSKPEPDGDTPLKWRPSIHMPKEAARIFLHVTDVRAEKLQAITEEDALREGVNVPQYKLSENASFSPHPIICFEKLWDNLNAKRGHGWETNPWVWVISFERIPSALPEGSSRQPQKEDI